MTVVANVSTILSLTADIRANFPTGAGQPATHDDIHTVAAAIDAKAVEIRDKIWGDSGTETLGDGFLGTEFDEINRRLDNIDVSGVVDILSDSEVQTGACARFNLSQVLHDGGFLNRATDGIIDALTFIRDSIVDASDALDALKDIFDPDLDTGTLKTELQLVCDAIDALNDMASRLSQFASFVFSAFVLPSYLVDLMNCAANVVDALATVKSDIADDIQELKDLRDGGTPEEDLPQTILNNRLSESGAKTAYDAAVSDVQTKLSALST